MKYAIIVGINKYKNSSWNLSGCVNDAKSVAALCKKLGFNKIILILNKKATQKKITTVLTKFINKTKSGDEILYYHSGHGAQVPDINGDEADKLDECLVTTDHNWEDAFTDDKLAQCLKNLHAEAYLQLIIDTCHSGSMTDYSKSIRMPKKLRKKIKGMTLKTYKFGMKNSDPGTQRHVLISGCRDDEYSYEVVINDKYCGAMTSNLVSVINKKSKRTWKNAFINMCKKVAKISPQNPRLTGRPDLLKRKIA